MALSVTVPIGEHEIIFTANGYYALRIVVDVGTSSITCKSAEYGNYDPATGTWTKIGNALCDACATKENGVCISDLTITGYLKPTEAPPPEKPPEKYSSFEEWLEAKGGPEALTYSDIVELAKAYTGFTDLGFSVTYSDVITAAKYYTGVTLSAKTLASKLVKELESVRRKSLIEKILNSLREKEREGGGHAD